MSQENERARVAERFLQSLLDGTPDLAVVTADFEYEQHFGSTAGRYVGEQGLQRWITTFYEVWDRATMRVDAVREAGDRIAVDVCVLVRGGKTGIEVELCATEVVRFGKDGGIERLDAFNEDDPADAALHEASL